MVHPANTCRSCGHDHLESVLDLGTTALADRMLYEKQLDEPEPTSMLASSSEHGSALASMQTLFVAAVVSG